MSKVEIPEGYKELSFNQPHIETLGPGITNEKTIICIWLSM